MSIQSLSPRAQMNWLGVRVKLAAEDGDWESVLQSLEQMSDRNPQSMQLLAARAVIMHSLNKVEQARHLYRSSSELGKSELGPAVAIFVGEQPEVVPDRPILYGYFEALALGDVDAARSIAGTLPPMQGFFRSDMLAVLDRPDVASRDMTEAFRFQVGAMAAIQCELPELAVYFAELAIRAKPSLVSAHSLRVRALLGMNKSIEPALESIRQISGSSLGLQLKSLEHAEKHQYTKAAQVLSQLAESDPTNPHVQYRMSQYYQLADQMDEAIALLREITSKNGPYKAAATNDLAYLLAEQQPQHLDEAARLAGEVFEAAPNSFALLDTLGWIEHLRGHDDQAIERLSKAIVGLSALPEVHYHLGVVYEALGNNTWARYHLEQASTGPSDRPESGLAKELLENLAN